MRRSFQDLYELFEREERKRAEGSRVVRVSTLDRYAAPA